MVVVKRALQRFQVVPALEGGIRVHVQVVVDDRDVASVLVEAPGIVVLEYVDLESIDKRVAHAPAVKPERGPPAVLPGELDPCLEIAVEEGLLRADGGGLQLLAVLGVVCGDGQDAIRHLHVLKPQQSPRFPLGEVERRSVELVGKHERPSGLRRIKRLRRRNPRRDILDALHRNLDGRCNRTYGQKKSCTLHFNRLT